MKIKYILPLGALMFTAPALWCAASASEPYCISYAYMCTYTTTPEYALTSSTVPVQSYSLTTTETQPCETAHSLSVEPHKCWIIAAILKMMPRWIHDRS